MEGAGACAGDLKSCVIGVGCGGVAQRELAVRGAERADGDGLAIGGSLPQMSVTLTTAPGEPASTMRPV
jgi:hypothetical protein